MTESGFGAPFRAANDVRQSFIDFFRERSHAFVPSSPVVPHDDPTLLFINAGMNQFKSAFLGDNREGYTRVVNSQKCIRVSGKHNDLDEVGRDTYHHTFFEMLGNWSFGDYYKREAIVWHWQLLTDVWKIPKERLFVSVHDSDDEAAEIWRSETDVDPQRIMRFGDSENFWEMGEVGPCGPCTEVHIDLGDAATRETTFRDPVGGVNGSDGRYVELCNLVFMQYERLSDGSLMPLAAKHVDTGMGFERICSILQGTGSNYATDVFAPLLQQIAELAATPYDAGDAGLAHRVIADHIRTLVVAITDGASPGNEGRGYVLRRILRRASRFARNLGQRQPFLYRLVPTVIESLGTAYPELAKRESYVTQVVQAEERRFLKTIEQGIARFEDIANQLTQRGDSTIPGAEAFQLYDTYGFPLDLTEIMAREVGLEIDQAGYEACMTEQRERARSAAKFDGSFASDEGWTVLAPGVETTFTGYEALAGATTCLRYREVGDDILVVLDRSPFYAEAGGQVGDVGWLSGEGVDLRVEDTFYILDMQVHRCRLLNGLVDDTTMAALNARVDEQARQRTVRNHSATHLLHAALRQILGDHVQQQGSRVSPEGLRFDFTHHQAMTPEEIAAVERLVNEHIWRNHAIAAENTSLAQAKENGAMALFGEKYGEHVRTIRMGPFSYELCGGTHAHATGEIGALRVVSESSISAGIRRIEAVTAEGVLDLVRAQEEQLLRISGALKTSPAEAPTKVQALLDHAKTLERQVKNLRRDQAAQQIAQLIDTSQERIGELRLVISRLDPAVFTKDTLATLQESMAERLGNGVGVLTHAAEGQLSIIAAVGQDARGTLKAGAVVKELAEIAGGRGGGRPDRAQAGSKHPEKEALVLGQARAVIESHLKG